MLSEFIERARSRSLGAACDENVAQELFMTIRDELVFEIMRGRQSGEPASEVCIVEAAVKELLAEFRTFAIAIDNHVPRNSECGPQCGINAGTPALLEINDGDTMPINGPAKGPT